MKNVRQPQNQIQKQNDAFHKVNCISSFCFCMIKLIAYILILFLFFIMLSLTLFWAAGTADEVPCVFFGHTFSLYYTFQKFFDGLATTFYQVLPVNGMFYERCLRTLPGIALVLYCAFSHSIYKKKHPKTNDIKITLEDQIAAKKLIDNTCIIMSLIMCAMACDRSMQGSFLEELISSGYGTPYPLALIITHILFSIPVFIVSLPLCHLLFRSVKAIYFNRDVKNAAISLLIIVTLLVLWFIGNSIYLLMKQYIGIAVFIAIVKIIDSMDFIIIF